MAKVLIIYAHPNPHKSRMNRLLVKAASQVQGVTLRDLYELYPTFFVDVEAEQQALTEHDIIALQHPFYWYSAPALLKEWLDQVFTYGWAYGEGASGLRGKVMLNALTTGGPEATYAATGRNRYPLREFLLPFDQSAHLCGMKYLAPFIIYGAQDYSTAEAAAPWISQYTQLLADLVAERVDLEQVSALARINSNLSLTSAPDA
jgi:glutathione-regulated potassium-efflux system ancillary protein KefG